MATLSDRGSAIIITFKAGLCALEGKKVKPQPTPGYIYLYSEEDLIHFCWRPRSAPATNPDMDLIMFPADGTFTPYLGASPPHTAEKNSPTNGRIFMLKFSSSSQRHFFWMQSKSQHADGKSSWFSERDQRIGKFVDALLSGEDFELEEDLAVIESLGGGDNEGPPRGDDEVMEDAPGGEDGTDHHRQGSGGAGPDATGGDPREEGEESRRGGEDGGRAASNDPSAIVQNFLKSLQGSSSLPQQSSSSQQSYDKPFTSLTELLNTNTTIPFLSSASPNQIDALCSHLPPSILLLSQESADTYGSTEPSPQAAQAAIEALSTEQKRDILQRVLRSPQLHQSLGSMTVALRDGGLPIIAEALNIDVENGGLIRGGSVPMGGGEAVEAFLEGVKKGVEEEKKQ